MSSVFTRREFVRTAGMAGAATLVGLRGARSILSSRVSPFAGSAALNALPRMPEASPSDLVLVAAEGKADFGGVTGYLTGSATSGRSSGDEYGVTLGVRVPF